MCRNIKTLYNFAPPATQDEIRASALQFVRKLSGFTRPSKANAAAFRLLFPTALCLMPAVYLFLLGPAIIELSDFLTKGGPEVLNVRARANAPPSNSGRSEMVITPMKARVPEASVPTKRRPRRSRSTSEIGSRRTSTRDASCSRASFR